jgi:hypothetical protein
MLVAMPEAAMDEDNLEPSCKYNVGATRQAN